MLLILRLRALTTVIIFSTFFLFRFAGSRFDLHTGEGFFFPPLISSLSACGMGRFDLIGGH